VQDHWITPTWTIDLSQQLVLLLQSPYYGTYHAVGQGVTNWYEFARAVLVMSGRDPAEIVPATTAEVPHMALRPRYSALDNYLLRLRRLERMLPWSEALRRYLSTRA
jgi:dTDP-4-dehydrorhamnose reductase